MLHKIKICASEKKMSSTLSFINFSFQDFSDSKILQFQIKH